MKNLPIDINCDMGESVGDQTIGQDEKLMPFITSCNIACGYHGGDEFHMKKTIDLALKHNVRIGAHPSYPDLEGFGRRKMSFGKGELEKIIKIQISTLKAHIEKSGCVLSYVKPHGALYNKASTNKEEAEIIIDSIQSIDPSLALMGLAGSTMEVIAREKSIAFIAEAFCDRKYEGDGTLMSREKPGSVFRNVGEVTNQVKSIVYENKVTINSNDIIQLNADSICIHGDNPMALKFLIAIHELFNNQSNEN